MQENLTIAKDLSEYRSYTKLNLRMEKAHIKRCSTAFLRLNPYSENNDIKESASSFVFTSTTNQTANYTQTYDHFFT